MRTTNKSLMEQLKLTPREVNLRKEYFGITTRDCILLQSLKETADHFLDEVVDQFYQQLVRFDEIDQIIGDSETLTRLKNHFKIYLKAIFEGEFDEEYVHSRLRVGVVHRRIGVESKYYVSAMHLLGQTIQKVIFNNRNGDEKLNSNAMEAINKVLMFDLSLVFDTYIHSLMDDSRRSRKKLQEYTESLEETIAERTKLLEEQARHDGLTGLLNQRSFFRELRKMLSRGQRKSEPVTLIYFDIDGFKNANDTLGHRAGDEILVKVAEAAKETTREGEIVARYGGDEFCIVLPSSTEEEGKVVAQRLCKKIGEKLEEHNGLSCSIGIATSSLDDFKDGDSMVKLADQAMYEAKRKKGYSIVTSGK